jgi:hypothetical protein
MNSYIHNEYEFILYLQRCVTTWALTGDAMNAADAAAGAAAGEMVNAAASAKVAADINDKHLRWLSKPSVTSEGGAFLAMADMWIQWQLAGVWI